MTVEAVGWTVHRHEGAWEVYCIVDGPDEFLRQRCVQGNLSLTEVAPDLLSRVNALHAEIASHFPPPELLRTSIGYVAGTIVEHIHHRFEGNVRPPGAAELDEVIWSYEVMRDGSSIKSQDPAAIDTSSLSRQSRRTIALLDKFARERVAGIYDSVLHSVTDGAPPPIPIPRFAAFISYRKAQIQTARVVQDVLEAFSNGANFTTNLDLDNIRLGNWESQLLGAITRCDLFVSVVTADFGEPGSFSHAEVEHARANNVPFAIFKIGPGDSPLWSTLRSMHACIVDDASALHLRNANVLEYLHTCVLSLSDRSIVSQ